MNSNRLQIFSVALMLLFSYPALPYLNEESQSIDISSQHQIFDMKKNIAKFTGQVILSQGSMKIFATSAELYHPGGVPKLTLADIYGDPITFRLTQEDGTYIEGKAGEVHYDTSAKLLVFKNSVRIKYLNNILMGSRASYLIPQGEIQFYGDNEERIAAELAVP